MSEGIVVVGIGSSAGGLEALQGVFSQMLPIPNCAFIIAQHLSPTHKSMMVDLLTRVTSLPVMEAKNGLVIRPKTIYMTPENTDIYVKDGKIFLKNLEQAFGPKPSVNYFFSSLASVYQDRAIGVILSGTGSDGAFGIRAIKAEGGITLAQSPATSKYDGMPVSAINTGKVDVVIPIENIASEIKSIIENMGKPLDELLDESHLNKIYKMLFSEKGVDFSLYKSSTVVRRIERRLGALKMDSLETYVQTLKENPEEITALYHDILIGVTQFFRDKEVFDVLRSYIEGVVVKKEQGEEIRFWSIGCSTGEEAYSLAILLSDVLGDKISKYKIKIFATDIDDEALKIARTGVYAEAALLGLDKHFIQKYFTVQKNQYEVKKSIRELVIFSRHNIVSDSPFLRMDLISCRNMLIYFDQALQNRFFPIIHYALCDGGIVLLGKSESIGSHYDLFTTLDKARKIFKGQITGIKEPPKLYNFSTRYKAYEEPKIKRHKNDEEQFEEKVIDATLSYLLNQCVVINSSHEILYVKGQVPYLRHQEGKVSNNIFKSIHEEITLDLRSAINEAQKHKELRQTPFRSIRVYEDVVRYLRIIVVPIQDERNDEWLSILFFQSEKPESIRGHISSGDSESETIQKLTLELDSTKSHLQNVIEELETSYEEMQSLNEELQSSNEELQSSNEELETTNEELQSTNEELQTAYSELKVLYEDKERRANQLEELSEKLKSQTENFRKQKEITEGIIDTAPVAITMSDDIGNIIFANAVAEKLFGLSKKQITSRTFDASSWQIEDFDGNPIPSEKLPFSLVKKTYDPVQNVQHTIITDEKKLFLSINGAPLFDIEGRFYGAVFCTVDMTELYSLKKEVALHKSMDGEGNFDNQLLKGLDELKQKGYIEFFDSKFDFMQFAMFDYSTALRNKLSDIMLLFKSLNQNCTACEMQKSFSKDIDATIEAMSKELDFMIAYYGESFKFQKSSLINELEHTFKVLEHTFEERDINVELELDFSCDMHLGSKQLKYLFLTLCEYFIYTKHEVAPDKKTRLHVKNYKNANGKSVVGFCLYGVGSLPPLNTSTPSFEAIQNRFGQLLGIKMSIEILKESLCIQMELV
jgi:two-component system CheB/CheR fusion protein